MSDLKMLESLLAELKPALVATAPSLVQELVALIAEVKKSPTLRLPPSAKGTLRKVFVWQLDLKRAELVERIEALEPGVHGDVKVAKAQKAFKKLVQAIDEAKRVVASGTGLKTLENVSDLARQALLSI